MKRGSHWSRWSLRQGTTNVAVSDLANEKKMRNNASDSISSYRSKQNFIKGISEFRELKIKEDNTYMVLAVGRIMTADDVFVTSSLLAVALLASWTVLKTAWK